MNLGQIRAEVEGHGFDDTLFPGTRINTYINDAYQQVASRVGYPGDEATFDFNTVAGTNLYAYPTTMMSGRSLRDTNRQIELNMVGLRTIDRSLVRAGPPYAYAFNGTNLQLYPSPDAVYPLELRYWALPTALVADTDVPIFPGYYHRMLWYWALKEAYASEDDSTTAQYWEQQFDKVFSEFEADVRFPSTDAPTRIASMWDGAPALSPGGWSIYGSDWD